MSLNAADQKIIDNVREYGWHGTYVPSDDIGPEFCFSTGFSETLHAPEVIIFGLNSSVMHNMLWEIFRQIKAGKALQDAAVWSGLIEGFDCVSRPVHPSHTGEYFGTAIWYLRYRGISERLDAFQVFWPGKLDGLYPWDTGCSEVVREHQPALYLPKATGLA
ncbi:MAG TPA: DUF4262 domain-containing protein [Rhizomicrobium sp.]